MKQGLLFLCVMLLLFSCTESRQESSKSVVPPAPLPLVVLQPIHSFDTSTLLFLKASIESAYPVRVKIAQTQPFPQHTYYKPRNRYRADRIIAWLKASCPDSVRTVVGVTTKDVSSTRNEQYDYGIMGLGYRPGRACVVSSHRPARTASNRRHLQERILKLVLHEMGHNFGLPHCADEQCIMVDAEGKMKLDREKGLCASCRKAVRI
jgi:archaemetzincin